MTTLLAVFAVSVACCLLLTPLVRLLAVRYRLVDSPDGRRKLQANPIPLGGGLAIFLSAVVAVFLAAMFSPLRSALIGEGSKVIGLGFAALFIAALGLVDDARGMRGIKKLLGQLIVVGIVMGSGVVIRSIQLFGVDVNLGLLSFPFTAFFLLGAINSLNLLDGMDGMLSSIGLTICLAITIIAALLANWTAACIAASLAGALLGFLRYNLPPATIFMGDCGSMVVGLVVGVVAIEGSLKGPATVALAAPLALLSLPIFDTSAAVVRRKLSGRSLFVSDRGHLHHCLLRSGLSPRGALLCIAALSLLTLVGAVASVAWHSQWVAIASILGVFNILIATRLFGHTELELLTKRVSAKLFRGGVRGGSQRVEVRIQGSADWPGLWRDLTSWAEELNLESMCLDINAPAFHEAYFGRWDRGPREAEDHNVWRAQIPLMAGGHSLGRLETVGRQHERSAGSQIATLASLMEKLEAALIATVGRSMPQPVTIARSVSSTADTISMRTSHAFHPSLATVSHSSADPTGLASLAHGGIAGAGAMAMLDDTEMENTEMENTGTENAEMEVAARETAILAAKEARKPR